MGRVEDAAAEDGRVLELEPRLIISTVLASRSFTADFKLSTKPSIYLELAYQDGSFRLVWLRIDPRFDGIRGDPRHEDLLRPHAPHHLTRNQKRETGTTMKM